MKIIFSNVKSVSSLLLEFKFILLYNESIASYEFTPKTNFVSIEPKY